MNTSKCKMLHTGKWLTAGWLLLVFSCTTPQYGLKRIQGSQTLIDSLIPADPEAKRIIEPYKRQLEAKMNRVLAYSKGNYYKQMHADKGETAIGDFLADLCMRRGGAKFQELTGKKPDFCLLNFGGIRDGIAQGDILVSTAYNIMPFENSMVVVELRYDKLNELFDYLVQSGKAHPFSRELTMLIRGGKLSKVAINGTKPVPDKHYFVLTSDYLQHGGDRMYFFKNPVSVLSLDYKIRDAILDEFEEIDTLELHTDGRMIRQ